MAKQKLLMAKQKLLMAKQKLLMVKQKHLMIKQEDRPRQRQAGIKGKQAIGKDAKWERGQ